MLAGNGVELGNEVKGVGLGLKKDGPGVEKGKVMGDGVVWGTGVTGVIGVPGSSGPIRAGAGDGAEGS